MDYFVHVILHGLVSTFGFWCLVRTAGDVGSCRSWLSPVSAPPTGVEGDRDSRGLRLHRPVAVPHRTTGLHRRDRPVRTDGTPPGASAQSGDRWPTPRTSQ